MEADEDENRSAVPRHFAIRDINWKLTFDENQNPVELFDLGSDIAESVNRINDPAQQQRIQDMTNLLGSTLSSMRSAP